MELVGWAVLVPLALASFVTGVVLSDGTPWGLFRHYWVVISLGLTILATGHVGRTKRSRRHSDDPLTHLP
jgi:hypothetical protein